MDISLLKEFLMVAKCRSVTEASKRLFVSQSTLSGHMKVLEQELDAVLYYREKPLRLTGAGIALVKHASVLVAQYEILLEAVADSSKTEEEVYIALNTTESASHRAWRALKSSLGIEHPRITVREILSKESTALGAIREESADCVLMGIAPLQSDLDAGLKCLVLDSVTSDRLYVWAHVSNPLASLGNARWSDLGELVHPSNTYMYPLWASSISNCLESNGVSVRFFEDQTEGLNFLFSLREDAVQIFDDVYRSDPVIAKIPNRVFVPIDEPNARDRACLIYDPDRVSPALRLLLDFAETHSGS